MQLIWEEMKWILKKTSSKLRSCCKSLSPNSTTRNKRLKICKTPWTINRTILSTSSRESIKSKCCNWLIALAFPEMSWLSKAWAHTLRACRPTNHFPIWSVSRPSKFILKPKFRIQAFLRIWERWNYEKQQQPWMRMIHFRSLSKSCKCLLKRCIRQRPQCLSCKDQ